MLSYIQRTKQFRTKKRLGQNFLVDESIIQRIIDEADLQPDETVIEIGAGMGFVTEKLAEKVKKVIAIELDEHAVKCLQKLPYTNIEIVHGDILKTDIFSLTDTPVKIIANIPYYITSPILVHLLGEIEDFDNKNVRSIKEVILMTQYEVGKRIIADEKSPSKEYGLLSLLVNYRAETGLICKVPARSFYPAPKVDSALLKLKIRKTPLVEIENPKLFKKIIRAAFGKRRKTIKNALLHAGFFLDIIIESLGTLNIKIERRGETLSMEEYNNLTRCMDKVLKAHNQVIDK